jgi:hypothetical protein
MQVDKLPHHQIALTSDHCGAPGAGHGHASESDIMRVFITAPQICRTTSITWLAISNSRCRTVWFFFKYIPNGVRKSRIIRLQCPS